MPLNFEVESLDNLDEPIAALYTKDETSGKYFLNVEGAVHKSKVSEYRDNNIKLLKERDELKAKMVDKSEIDKIQEQFEAEKAQLASELEKLKASKEELKDDKSKDNSEELKQLNKSIKQLEAIKKAQESELTSVKTELSKQIDEIKQQFESKSRAYNTVLLNSAVNEAAVAAGVDPNALAAVKALATTTFKIEGDSIVAYDPNDGSPLFSKDGSTNLSVKEWAANLKETMPQLFIQPKGAGTQKSSLNSGSVDANLTPLQRIQQGLGAKK